MVEQVSGRQNPDAFLADLFQSVGGRGGTRVEYLRESSARHRIDPLVQARRSAEQGILQSAMEYIMASDLSTYDKLTKISEMATVVLGVIATDPSKTVISDTVAGQKAIEVMERSSDYLASLRLN